MMVMIYWTIFYLLASALIGNGVMTRSRPARWAGREIGRPSPWLVYSLATLWPALILVLVYEHCVSLMMAMLKNRY